MRILKLDVCTLCSGPDLPQWMEVHERKPLINYLILLYWRFLLCTLAPFGCQSPIIIRYLHNRFSSFNSYLLMIPIITTIPIIHQTLSFQGAFIVNLNSIDGRIEIIQLDYEKM